MTETNSFRKKSRRLDQIGAWFIRLNALATVAVIFLIFVFIFKEAIPIFTDPQVREEAGIEKMLLKQSFDTEAEPKYTWQPNSNHPKYSIPPLVIGTLKAALIAMLVAIPLGVGAAIYSAEFASRRMREYLKPVIELLAGIPSVVLGFFALIVLAGWLQDLFGFTYRLNAITAGVALGIAITPVIFTVAEDAMMSVPNSLRDAAVALGANPWQVSLTMVLPAAMPGIAAGIVLGFGRAVGETMIVLMATGNAPIWSGNFADSVRTLSATIAAELGEVVFGSTHWNVLFFIGSLLFVFTFLINFAGDVVLSKVKERMQGKTT